MSFTGKNFPNITVDAIDYLGDNLSINIFEKAQKENKKILLFWYPKDFTFVCPTELHAFQEAVTEFEKRNTIVIGASCDSNEVHFAWLNTAKDNGGIEGVEYPILGNERSRAPGVWHIGRRLCGIIPCDIPDRRDWKSIPRVCERYAIGS